jgi:hypothetical protein
VFSQGLDGGGLDTLSAAPCSDRGAEKRFDYKRGIIMSMSAGHFMEAGNNWILFQKFKVRVMIIRSVT